MIGVTRFQEFLLTRHIIYADLARASGYSRQHILKLRKGLNHPTRRCIAALVRACRRLTKEKVKASDLFDGRARPTCGLAGTYKSRASRHIHTAAN
jgi:hypothetical protein